MSLLALLGDDDSLTLIVFQRRANPERLIKTRSPFCSRDAEHIKRLRSAGEGVMGARR